jgi:hypothetical protein
LGLVAGPIKSPGPSSLARAVSDRTPSFSVCAFAVELGPHHGTRTRYPLFPYQYKDGTAVSRWPPRAAAGRENRPAGWRPVRCLVARSSRDIGKPESTPMVRIFLRARNDRVTSILLKNSLSWRPRLGFVAMSARQIPGSPPHVAKMRAGSGMSFASFRRFWAVAAKRNSSLAPFGPRRRNRPSLRMLQMSEVGVGRAFGGQI